MQNSKESTFTMWTIKFGGLYYVQGLLRVGTNKRYSLEVSNDKSVAHLFFSLEEAKQMASSEGGAEFESIALEDSEYSKHIERREKYINSENEYMGKERNSMKNVFLKEVINFSHLTKESDSSPSIFNPFDFSFVDYQDKERRVDQVLKSVHTIIQALSTHEWTDHQKKIMQQCIEQVMDDNEEVNLKNLNGFLDIKMKEDSEHYQNIAGIHITLKNFNEDYEKKLNKH